MPGLLLKCRSLRVATESLVHLQHLNEPNECVGDAVLAAGTVWRFEDLWHDGNQRVLGGCGIGEMKGELFADPDKAVEDFVYFIFEHLADIVSAWEHDGMSKHCT